MTCHAVNATSPMFTDNLFHNIGVAAHKPNFVELARNAFGIVQQGNVKQIDELALQTDLSELGRFLVTKRTADIVKGFRTPAGHGRDEGLGGRRPKSIEGGNRGGVCASGGVGLWGFSARV